MLRSLATSLVLVICPPAQNVLFEERFDRGIPAAWTQDLLGVGADIWRAGTNPSTNDTDAYHEYFCTNGTLLRDNRLVTPAIDLRGLRDATLTWDDFQVLPTWRQLNAVEVSIGGGPFSTIYAVTATSAGGTTLAVDVSALAGRPDVRFGFRYRGDIANEWRIDNVRITTSHPVLSIRGLTAGATAEFRVDGASAGSAVTIALSLHGPGPLATLFGDVFLTPPVVLLPSLTAGANGVVALPIPIPASASGLPLWTHAVVLMPSSTARLTNAVASSVR